jgi:hypothetical protein
MRPTMVLPIVVILLAAGAVLFVRSKPAGLPPAGPAEPNAEPEPTSAGRHAKVEVAASTVQPSPR